jgi:hypothetical protein
MRPIWSAVIITEQEHDDDYTMQDPNEVVFVLPNDGRLINNPAHLLNTAKLLMACTPNGICRCWRCVLPYKPS